MAKVGAKHANCSVFGCTEEHRTLFRFSASEEMWIYWFIYSICCHTDLIWTWFLSQLFTFTDITGCFCNSCVFNMILCVFHILSSIRHERELTLVLSRRVTAAFCARASNMCAQKTLFQMFRLIWFKTWFQRVIHDKQNQTDVFFGRVSEEWAVKAQLHFLKRGRAAAVHLHLKRHALKQALKIGIFKMI